MGFFEEQERESEPVREPVPDWLKPPGRIIGMPLSNTVVMTQNDDHAVVLTRFVAYPQGLAWEVTVRFAGHVPGNRHQTAWDAPGRAMFGIRCADGTAVFRYLPNEVFSWKSVGIELDAMRAG
jgi:hypothetical protein